MSAQDVGEAIRLIPTTRFGAVSHTFQCIATALTVLMLVAVPAAPRGTNSVTDTSGVFTFMVIGDVSGRVENVVPMYALLDAIDAEHPAFAVHLGNLKGCDEVCSDTLLEARHDLLDSLITSVIYIPGDHDWSDCQHPAAGSFDPMECLLRLRELFYPDDNTLGQRIMTATCRPDQTKFRSYRENTRWAVNNTLFVTLGMPSDSNNYKTAGGYNGEYKDRLEANHQWLARVFIVARQHKIAGVVVIMQVDPLFEDGRERRHVPNLFDDLLRRHSRDGYLALKRQMRSLTRGHDDAVLLIHDASQTFMLDRPLKNEDGRPDAHVMRARICGSPVLDR